MNKKSKSKMILIQVSRETAGKLKQLGTMAMTYDSTIRMLIEKFYKGAK